MNSANFTRHIALAVLALVAAGPISRSAYAVCQSQVNQEVSANDQPDAQPVASSDLAVVTVVEASTAKTTESNVPAPPSGGSAGVWAGPYIGINVGYGSGNANTFVNPLPTAAIFVNLLPQTLHPNPTGLIGGGQLGYNWQRHALVLGVETDFSGTQITGTQTVTPIIQNNNIPFPNSATPCTACFVRAHQDIAWFGTLRARGGFAFSRVLVYGTGGLGYGRINNAGVTDFQPVGTTIYTAAPNQTKSGWTGGGGAEFAVGRGWSVRGEYLHYDLGSVSKVANPQFVFPPFQVGYSWQINGNLARFGLNYRF